MADVQGLPEGVTLEQFWSPQYQANLNKNNPFVSPTVTSDVNSSDAVTNAVVQDESSQINPTAIKPPYEGVMHDGQGGYTLMIDGVKTAVDVDGNPLTKNEIDKDKDNNNLYSEEDDPLKKYIAEGDTDGDGVVDSKDDGFGGGEVIGDDSGDDSSGKMGGLFGFMKDDKGLFQGGTSGKAFGRLRDLFAGKGFNAGKNTTESGSLDFIQTENLGESDGSGGTNLKTSDGDGEGGGDGSGGTEGDEEPKGPNTQAMAQMFMQMGQGMTQNRPSYEWSGDDIF
tara:strand:- start:27 stop:872 length:846 start_codon:yes stop_codon:yes gene_type:complete